MSIDVVALDPSAEAWIDALSDVRHDAYHLPSYVSFAARHHEVGEPRLFVAEGSGGRLLLPLIVRRLPTDVAGDADLWDATSSRGYPGPTVAAARLDHRFIAQAIKALRDYLAEHRIVSAFVRLHPLLSIPDDALEGSGTVVDHGDSVYIDLSKSDEELAGQMRHGHRQDINRARRLGYETRIDDAWERFDDFVAVFHESMDRVGAVPFWRFSPQYFVDLRESLSDRIRLCVVEKDGELASAALVTEVDGIVEYHLAGTANAHLRASPSKLVVDFLRRWSRDRGNRVLHLTGSLRRGDSLSSFKMGFSPLHRPVRSWRVVSHREHYARLIENRRRHGTEPDGDDGYFPAYRRPRTDGG